jgi:Ca2+-transporting ATPase
VIRDGLECQVPARELVPGDVMLVAEGERLAADGVLIGGDVLSVDESSLTGESAPVTKPPVAEPPVAEAPAPGAESTPFVFAGALIVRG